MIINISLLMMLIILRIKILMKIIMAIVIMEPHVIHQENSDISNSELR